MNIADLIGPENVLALRAADKPQLLNELARRAAKAVAIEIQPLLDALLAREGLGSTGVGQGVAVPHARIPGLQRFFGIFARLERPIDFAAIDGRPVDLVFLLLIPASAGNEHLAALACVARRLRERDVAESLRYTNKNDLYHSLIGAA